MDLRQQFSDAKLIDASRTLYLYKDDDNAEMVNTIAAAFEDQFKEIIIVDVTGIRGICNRDSSSSPNAIYDLQGRRVDHPSNGFYIVNGKKVYIK